MAAEGNLRVSMASLAAGVRRGFAKTARVLPLQPRRVVPLAKMSRHSDG